MVQKAALYSRSGMPPLTSDLSMILKDGLRGARYAFRKGTRIGKEAATLAPAVPRLARLADSVFTVTEKAAAALLSSDEAQLSTAEGFAQTVSAMLATRDRNEFKTLFVRIVFRLAEATLTRLGVENAFISAHEIAAAGWLLRHRHRKTLAAVTARRPLTAAVLARFWSTTLVCLEQRRAIREIDLPPSDGIQKRLLQEAPETYCLLILAIAGASLTMRHLSDAPRDHDVQDCTFDEYIDSAISVVTARFDRLSAHATVPDAIELLSADLEGMLPFLP
jgi:hypothetical protein